MPRLQQQLCHSSRLLPSCRTHSMQQSRQSYSQPPLDHLSHSRSPPNLQSLSRPPPGLQCHSRPPPDLQRIALLWRSPLVGCLHNQVLSTSLVSSGRCSWNSCMTPSHYSLLKRGFGDEPPLILDSGPDTPQPDTRASSPGFLPGSKPDARPKSPPQFMKRR
ncbi:hypothetical protein XENOCAPTIV_028621 [Xenoophorus captivus]|uniref:Uncharacterized protein n=1 Tax=Xenoophorus captivus TaxID=1517983 RepID=A0ABV0S3E6_9TELE